MTPSREAIQFTKRSIENLEAIIAPEFEIARADLYKLIGDAKTVSETIDRLVPATADRKDQIVMRGAETRSRHYITRVVENFCAAYKAETGLDPVWIMRNGRFEGVLAADNSIQPGAHWSVYLSRATLTRLGVVNGLFYTANVTSNDDSCVATPANDLHIPPFTPVLYVPSALRNWEDRCHYFMRRKSPFTIGQRGVTYVVVRANRADLPKIKEYVDAHNVVTFDLTDDAELIEPPKIIAARANRVVKPRPAPNDAFELTSSGSWNEVKNVDFSEPCYLVVRDKRYGVIGIADDAARAEFDKLKVGADGTFTGLTLRATVNESSFARVLKAARGLGIVDTNLPVYSLNRSQYERLVKQGTTPTLLMDAIVDALTAVTVRMQNDMTVAMAIRQNMSAATTRSIKIINNLTPDVGVSRLKLAQAMLSDPLFAALYAMSRLTVTTFAGSPYLSTEAKDMVLAARNVTGRYDDLISLLTNEYTALYGRLNQSRKVSNVHTNMFVLMPEEYEITGSVDIEADTFDYVLAKVSNPNGTNDARAKALLADLPPAVRKVVTGIMKDARVFVAQALSASRNKPQMQAVA